MNTVLIEVRLRSLETRQHRDAGETLFREGAAPDGVYILYSGAVDLLFAARNGIVKPLRVATPGQILGLSEVVVEQPYDCSAITRVPCDVGFIPREEFLSVLQERPAVWLNVLSLLSNDVNAVYDDMRALAVG